MYLSNKKIFLTQESENLSGKLIQSSNGTLIMTEFNMKSMAQK